MWGRFTVAARGEGLGKVSRWRGRSTPAPFRDLFRLDRLIRSDI